MPPPAPILVQRASSGPGYVVTGFLLGRATSSAHAHRSSDSAASPNTAGQRAPFVSMLLPLLPWLALLALLAWLCWRVRHILRRALASTSANYSFKR